MATAVVLEAIINIPQLLLCAATGDSPLGLYHKLGLEAAKQPLLFEQLRVIPLDEWVGLKTPEGSCHTYLQQHLLGPLKISKQRYFSYNARAENMEAECSRIHSVLLKEGPIDLCILGLGKNGHLGFNEPAAELQPHCHLAKLSDQSQTHGMIGKAKVKPTLGISLGIKDILSSKRILILVSGQGKEAAKTQLLSGAISPQWPATMLWKHKNVDCLVLE